MKVNEGVACRILEPMSGSDVGINGWLEIGKKKKDARRKRIDGGGGGWKVFKKFLEELVAEKLVPPIRKSFFQVDPKFLPKFHYLMMITELMKYEVRQNWNEAYKCDSRNKVPVFCAFNMFIHIF